MDDGIASTNKKDDSSLQGKVMMVASIAPKVDIDKRKQGEAFLIMLPQFRHERNYGALDA